jgi:hypothetical protein
MFPAGVLGRRRRRDSLWETLISFELLKDVTEFFNKRPIDRSLWRRSRDGQAACLAAAGALPTGSLGETYCAGLATGRRS